MGERDDEAVDCVHSTPPVPGDDEAECPAAHFDAGYPSGDDEANRPEVHRGPHGEGSDWSAHPQSVGGFERRRANPLHGAPTVVFRIPASTMRV